MVLELKAFCCGGGGQALRTVSNRLLKFAASVQPSNSDAWSLTTTMAASTVTTLPYFCDPDVLSAPLPSTEEIIAADQTFPTNAEDKYQQVALVKGRFIVKHGVSPWVSENEGHALLLLAKYPSIPAPRLYAMYRNEENRLFLIMEYKPGTPLSTVWDGLSEHDKLGITGELRDIFAQVRQVPSPGVFSNTAGGPLRHRFFLSTEPTPEINGPFKDERAFSMAMAIRSRRNWESSGYKPWSSEFFERHLPTALTGHTSVFTHDDLQRKNVLVSRGGGAADGGSLDEGAGGWRVTAVVDWENAGWYPSYWEYASAFVDFVWDDDWPEKFERIVQPCPLEAGLLRFVRQDVDGY
ncbi:kinase-like domain-containing protein [Chaetomium tenue]|uniref:Kinase-like domain-containing protein n=1 Tax=Chaetomium tenue TaxID=1854479 RepID=A0ACB7PJH9_9PEZI|nr:kinase-like domain-containing protein [Chaetomium globosum]